MKTDDHADPLQDNNNLNLFSVAFAPAALVAPHTAPMFAVHRPMGPSKPVNLEMPFGYSFDNTNSNFPFPSPTTPAPGSALLDDHESKFLNSFFEDVSSDQFNYNYFPDTPNGSGHAFGWEELPPAFMGTTSSFGQQPQIGAQQAPTIGFDPLPSQLQTGPPIPPETSADVLAAATLLQSSSSGRPHNIATDASVFRAPNMSIPPTPTNGQVRPPSHSQYQQVHAFSGNHERSSSNEFLTDNYYADMVFGSPADVAIRPRNANQKLDIRWGSDAAFGTPSGFMAPSDHDTVAEVERAQIQSLESAFKIERGIHSAETSNPPSPAGVFQSQTHKKSKSAGQLQQADKDSRSQNRRKSIFDEEDDAEIDTDPALRHHSSSKKRKAVKKEFGNIPAQEPAQNHKRRKSSAGATAAAGKAARENLTEGQKRENHIRSEQKRRTLIREGFEDLGELVPGLRGGGFSKSAVLLMAADWLQDLLHGNEVLKNRLNQMEGRS